MGRMGVAAAAGIVEGDYTTWTHKWTKMLPGGINDWEYSDFFLDDKNGKIMAFWEYRDVSLYNRFGVFNISDLSQVFISPPKVDYQYTYPAPYTAEYIHFGMVVRGYGTTSKSFQTYVLFLLSDGITMEIWRGDSNALWSRNIQNDESGETVGNYIISPSGKYVLIVTMNEKLMLYEGI